MAVIFIVGVLFVLVCVAVAGAITMIRDRNKKSR